MDSMRFLTADEVAHLTGYTQRQKQRDYLIELGIPFRVSYIGDPIVLLDDIKSSQAQESLDADGPRWDAL